MTLQASGSISIGQISTELGLTAATATRSLNDTTTRKLLGKLSGTISLSNSYSKRQGISSYPTGLPIYVAPSGYNAGQSYIAPTGNVSYPSGLPVYNAGQGNPNYPGGLGQYRPSYYGIVAATNINGYMEYTYGTIPEEGNPNYPGGLPYYIAPTGNISYPNGLPIYNAGRLYIAPYYTNPGQGNASYPTGLPVYIS